MLVYRICLAKWAGELKASGFPARWNSKGKFVIYTAESRALACLENIVHRNGEGLSQLFKVIVIEVPDVVSVNTVDVSSLSDQWRSLTNYSTAQLVGDNWLDLGSSCLLKVPSVIIPEESNYLINPSHEDFRYIKIKSVD